MLYIIYIYDIYIYIYIYIYKLRCIRYISKIVASTKRGFDKT